MGISAEEMLDILKYSGRHICRKRVKLGPMVRMDKLGCRACRLYDSEAIGYCWEVVPCVDVQGSGDTSTKHSVIENKWNPNQMSGK